MPGPERIVVVGGGLAGARTLAELRGRDYRGRLTLVGAEAHLPYDRPPLSKQLLRGETDDTTVQPTAAELDCELLLGRQATGLRPGVLETDAGPVDFDSLVVATGSAPVRLPGAPQAVTLRTVDDARRLRAQLRPGTRWLIAGAGWIGAEVATAAAAAGCPVTVLELAETPLAQALGVEVGGATAPWYAEAGVRLRTGTGLAAAADGRAELTSGETVEVDVLLVAVGVRPAGAWVGDGGAGVTVSAQLRADLPDVFAVGDVAAWHSARFARRLTVQHWDNALRAPAVVAENLLGGDARYDPVPYFWSEQFGRMLQYAGDHQAADRLVWRGTPAHRRWTACWLSGERLDAVCTVDQPRDLVQARKLITVAARMDLDRLADPTVPLRDAVVDPGG